MKRFLFTIVCCVTFATACSTKSDSEIDKSTVWFEAEECSLPASGGQVIIPVHSTGVDYATIKYTFEDAWDFNAEGNMVPREGWISIEVIPNYPEARALMTGRSGVQLTVQPNKTIANRTAWLIVGSYNQTASILLRQPSTTAKE